MITEAHNYTLIDTWIYGMGNECNPGIKGQYTLHSPSHIYTLHTLRGKHTTPHTSSWQWHIFLSGCKVNVKCMAGNDDVKALAWIEEPHMALSVRVITLLRL